MPWNLAVRGDRWRSDDLRVANGAGDQPGGPTLPGRPAQRRSSVTFLFGWPVPANRLLFPHAETAMNADGAGLTALHPASCWRRRLTVKRCLMAPMTGWSPPRRPVRKPRVDQPALPPGPARTTRPHQDPVPRRPSHHASLLIMDGVPVRPSGHARAAVPLCSPSASNPLGGARVRGSRARPIFRFRLGAAGVRAHRSAGGAARPSRRTRGRRLSPWMSSPTNAAIQAATATARVALGSQASGSRSIAARMR